MTVLLAAVLVPACGARVSPFAGAQGTTVGAATTTTAPATSAGSGTATTTAGPGTAVASRPATTAPANKVGSGAAGGGTSNGSGGGGGAGGPRPVTAGTYRYRQSGSFTALNSTQQDPAQGTIVVDAASATGPGAWTQVWHSYVDTSQQPSDSTFALSASGIDLDSEVLRMTAYGQTVVFDCTFSPPLEIMSWPPKVGYSFSGNGTCTSSNGSFPVAVTGKIDGTQSDNVGGTSVNAYVVDTTATTTGEVASTSQETDWFDPTSGLDVHQETSEQGTYNGVKFSSQLTRDLNSLSPS